MSRWCTTLDSLSSDTQTVPRPRSTHTLTTADPDIFSSMTTFHIYQNPSYAGDTRSKNLYHKLAQETCIKNLTRVHHSSLHNNNNWPANHVARFVSRAGQFLCWNRLTEPCSDVCKKLVQEKTCWRQTDTLARQLAPVSDTSFSGVCRRHYCPETINPLLSYGYNVRYMLRKMQYCYSYKTKY